ncbi:hypothetical protein J2755_001976 [Methanohalophilus levihalophilus]|uniref:DUF7289 family protein n=1 Tax=Methanohalophilus levihalophilus TaxID=1431282 RepID=UPI001FDAC746|nr:hypothetical protein [Methanohalophilus levihalophilus]MBP2031028.1 hypothetical protein [Methanohalophilus levihalophilus]
MFSLGVVAMGITLLYGVPIINDMQDNAQVQKIEEGFTILDSRSSKVALGESPTQTISTTLIGGGITVKDAADPNSSTITVQISNSSNNYSEEFSTSLGTLEYIKNDRYVAYEGGGVWSKYENSGGAVMISPPEFHYNGETLTLPIMNINGNTSSAGYGDVRIAVISDNKPEILYPNTVVSPNRTNPISAEEITMYIKSDYYDGWADYAESLTYTSATVDHTNKTAILKFTTIPPMGTLPLTNQIKIPPLNQANQEPIQEFSFYFEALNDEGLSPKNYQLETISGSRTLTYKLQKTSDLQLDVIYKDTDISSKAEEWTSKINYPINGSQEDENSTVDFTNETFVMRYTANDPDFSWPDDTITKFNESFSINNLTQHYLKLMTENGAITFDVGSATPKDPVDYSTSTYTLIYDTGPGAITYLHITKNELFVDVS